MVIAAGGFGCLIRNGGSNSKLTIKVLENRVVDKGFEGKGSERIIIEVGNKRNVRQNP